MSSFVAAQTQKPESVYTTLGEKDCKENEPQPEYGDAYLATCKGIGGYSLVSIGTDHTHLIDLIAPDGTNIDLAVRSQFQTAAPSGLGDKVEWRVIRNGKRIEPKALIVRVNIFSDPDDSMRAVESYLVVVKLDGSSSCTVGVIGPSKGQNTAARAKADSAASLPCVKRDA